MANTLGFVDEFHKPRIDVAHQAPVSGSYDGVSPMGLFWSMARLPGEALPVPSDWVMRPHRVRLEATSAEGVGAATLFERRIAAPGVTRQPIRTAGLVGTLFLPPGDGEFPTVIVVSGGCGVIEEFPAAVLASHGYAALALALSGNARAWRRVAAQNWQAGKAAHGHDHTHHESSHRLGALLWSFLPPKLRRRRG